MCARPHSLPASQRDLLGGCTASGNPGAAAAPSPCAQGAAGAASEAAERAEAAEARAARLEAECEGLVREVGLLQARVGAGEFNAATTKVLHFRHNPEAELAREARDARVAELESENDALRAQVQRMEAAYAASGGGADGAAPGAPGGGGGSAMRLAQLEGEANLLRRRAAELQKGSDRLQAVFNRQVTLFREAVLLLFGYRLEMTTDPAAAK